MEIDIHSHERQDGEKEGQRFAMLTDNGVEAARAGKEPEHRVFGGVAHEIPPRMAWCLEYGIGTILLPALLGLTLGQAVRRREQRLEPQERDRTARHQGTVFS
jgi:hypothetical protein